MNAWCDKCDREIPRVSLINDREGDGLIVYAECHGETDSRTFPLSFVVRDLSSNMQEPMHFFRGKVEHGRIDRKVKKGKKR